MQDSFLKPLKIILLSLGLSVILCLALSVESNAMSRAPGLFDGKECTSNSYAAATIDYCINKYDYNSKFTGGGQCHGYAEVISTNIASSRKRTTYYARSLTTTNFRNLCLNIKAGAHFRMSKYKSYNPMKGHSVVLLKVTNSKVCWTDNNSIGYNRIAYYEGTLNEFVNRYRNSFKYINAITRTLTYRASSTPKLSTTSTKSCSVKLTWTKTTNTQEYIVYRAYSKYGTYKEIKRTTAKSFYDKVSTVGKTCYYKVKSVRTGTDKTSNIATGIRRK